MEILYYLYRLYNVEAPVGIVCYLHVPVFWLQLLFLLSHHLTQRVLQASLCFVLSEEAATACIRALPLKADLSEPWLVALSFSDTWGKHIYYGKYIHLFVRVLKTS